MLAGKTALDLNPYSMIYLLLCIFMNVLVYVNFKLFPKFRINPTQAIVFNYFFCVIAGLALQGSAFDLSGVDWRWIASALALGVLFIVNFNMISRTTQNFGIGVASVATKLSLIIPVAVSLFLLPTQFKEFNIWNYAGIALALPAVVLGSYQKGERRKSAGIAVLPFLVFFLSGTIDAFLNISNFYYVGPRHEPAFLILIFLCASAIGGCWLAVKRRKVEFKSVLGGLFLALPNFLALLFLMRSLRAFNNDGSLVYPPVNMGVIALAFVVSTAFFKESPGRLNIAGIALSLISIALIFHQELIGLLRGGF